MLYETRHPDFSAVIAEEARLETIGHGYEFTEGPAWHPNEGHLTFSDIAGNAMYRWKPGDGAPKVFREPSHKANGNTYDGEGRLLTCEHATSRVVREEKDGGLTVLASHYGGKELNSPNDIIVNPLRSDLVHRPSAGTKAVFRGSPRPGTGLSGRLADRT